MAWKNRRYWMDYDDMKDMHPEEIDNSLVPYSRMVGPGLKVLEFHRDRCVIDLNPLFRDLFERRDAIFGKPEAYSRVTPRKNVTIYRFQMTELFEAFLTRYSIEKFASFLEQHLCKEDELNSETLVSRIRGARKYYKFVTYCRDGDYYRPFKRLVALNFDAQELSRKLPNGILSKTNKKKHASQIDPVPGFEKTVDCLNEGDIRKRRRPPERFTPLLVKKCGLRKLRDILDVEKNGIVLIDPVPEHLIGIPPLHYFGLVKYYHLSTADLMITRRPKD